MFRSAFLLATFVPLILGQCNVDKALPLFKRSAYEFSVELVQRVAEDTDNHFVTSSLSLWSLLSSIAAGAEGQTLEELKHVLHQHPHKCFNDKYQEIVKRIAAATYDTTLKRSSTVYIDKSFPVLADYERRLITTGVCDIVILPFANYAAVSLAINNHVARATHNAIEEIVTPSDIEGAYVILIDAIYFKSGWKIPFSPEDTELSTFYDERGNQVGDVNLMISMDYYNVASVSQIQAKVLELPYGNDDRFSMLILLPNKNGSINSVIDSLKSVTLTSIFNVLQQSRQEIVQVQIPKFKISSDLDNLKELLTDMGIRTMFDSLRAQFTRLSDYPLFVSNVVQKATIEVTEEGTEASAAGEAGMSSRTLPEQFTANKPFLFMIVDKSVNIALFTGAYSKPSYF